LLLLQDKKLAGIWPTCVAAMSLSFVQAQIYGTLRAFSKLARRRQAQTVENADPPRALIDYCLINLMLAK